MRDTLSSVEKYHLSRRMSAVLWFGETTTHKHKNISPGDAATRRELLIRREWAANENFITCRWWCSPPAQRWEKKLFDFNLFTFYRCKKCRKEPGGRKRQQRRKRDEAERWGRLIMIVSGWGIFFDDEFGVTVRKRIFQISCGGGNNYNICLLIFISLEHLHMHNRGRKISAGERSAFVSRWHQTSSWSCLTFNPAYHSPAVYHSSRHNLESSSSLELHEANWWARHATMCKNYSIPSPTNPTNHADFS